MRSGSEVKHESHPVFSGGAGVGSLAWDALRAGRHLELGQAGQVLSAQSRRFWEEHMKTTVKQLIEKFDAWSNEPKDDRLSREVVADLIREAIAAKESGELTEPEPELEPAKDLVPARPWGIEDTGQNLWVGPLRVDGKINEIVFHIPLAGLKAGSAARHRKSAKLIVAAVNAYKAEAKPESEQPQSLTQDLIPPTPWRWEAKGDWITMLNAKSGLVFGLPLPPSQREQLQHLFACIAFSVNKCNTEANSEAIDVSHGIIQIPATPELEGWQPLTMNNHPPFGVEAEFQTRHDAYQRPYIPPRWLSMKLNDIHDLTEAIAVGWHHWRVPKTDEAKGTI